MATIKFQLTDSKIFNMGQTPNYLNDVIDDIIKILPRGTTLKFMALNTKHKSTMCSVWDIELDCPFFQSDMEIDPVINRNVLVDGSGKIHEFNTLVTLDLIKGSPILPIGSNPTTQQPTNILCKHDYTTYHGFTDSYEYCRICGEKK